MSFATLDGQDCGNVRLVAPWIGIWFAEVELHDETVPTGPVTLTIGSTTFIGTVDDSRSSVFAGKARVFIVGGAGQWGKVLPSRPYHNDGVLLRSQLAVDIGIAAGETVTVSSVVDGSVGVDWPRESAPAVRLLEQLFPSTPWYVGADGVTRVGPRTFRDVSTAVQLLSHDPAGRSAELAIEDADMSVALPGASITDVELLGATPFLVRETVLRVTTSAVRATVYEDSLTLAMREIVREASPRQTFFGVYRYRVFEMSLERVKLQAFSKEMGIPDQVPISIWPGMPGIAAQLTPGAIVLVQFIDGNPALPFVCGFAREGDPGFLPLSIAIDATSEVHVGETALDTLIGAGLARILRHGEKVKISGLTAPSGGGPVTSPTGLVTIELDTTMVAPGAPGAGYSKGKA